MNGHDTFEDRLLTQLKHAVDERPTRHRGRVLAVGAGLGLTAVLGFGIPTVMAGTASAYEITEDGDSLTIEIRELTDAEGLEAALAEYGLDADVTYLPHGKACADGRYTPVAGDDGIRAAGRGDSGGKLRSFGIELEGFDSDNTLVIEISATDGSLVSIGPKVGATSGEVGECEVVDSPFQDDDITDPETD